VGSDERIIVGGKAQCKHGSKEIRGRTGKRFPGGGDGKTPGRQRETREILERGVETREKVFRKIQREDDLA